LRRRGGEPRQELTQPQSGERADEGGKSEHEKEKERLREGLVQRRSRRDRGNHEHQADSGKECKRSGNYPRAIDEEPSDSRHCRKDEDLAVLDSTIQIGPEEAEHQEAIRHERERREAA
jgi:hypothetical protein